MEICNCRNGKDVVTIQVSEWRGDMASARERGIGLFISGDNVDRTVSVTADICLLGLDCHYRNCKVGKVLTMHHELETPQCLNVISEPEATLK